MQNDNAEKPALIDDLINLSISLLKDATRFFESYTDKDYARDVRTIKKRGLCEGIVFFTSTITNLSQGLLNYLEYNSSDYPNFAKKDTFEYPAFLSGIFKLAYDVSCNDHIRAVGFIYQFGSAFKKLKGNYPDGILQKQIEEFVENDANLSSFDNKNEADQLIIEHARAFVTRVFGKVSEDDAIFDITPRPGPGATNTKVAAVERYRPHCLYQQIEDVFPSCEWHYATYNEWVWDIPRYRKLWLTRKETTTARYEIVPKYYNKPRGICIEENEMQYMQQGVKSFLYKYIEKHALTIGKINFTNQEVNQRLAYASSLTRYHATIDMKDASDRISLNLVKDLFRDVPILLNALVALSTRTVTFSKRNSVELLKYAPMGSGLCFPVMSIVHYALIHSILYISMQSDKVLSEIYVYGDDIIIPSSCTQAVYDWLPRFGMKLNVNKSYSVSSFRESCGVHAYKGVDITPVYFKYTTGSIHTLDGLSSLISNESLLYTKGYYMTSAHIRSSSDLPYVGLESSAIGWRRSMLYLDKNLDLSKYRCRWNATLQRTEYHIYTVRTVDTGKQVANDNDMYLRSHLLKAHSHDSFWMRRFIKKRRTWLSLHDIYSCKK